MDPAVTTKRRLPRTSPIWNFYTEDTQKKLAVCVLCGSLFKYQGHTSNLYKHMKVRHKTEAMTLKMQLNQLQMMRKEQAQSTQKKSRDYEVKVVGGTRRSQFMKLEDVSAPCNSQLMKVEDISVSGSSQFMKVEDSEDVSAPVVHLPGVSVLQPPILSSRKMTEKPRGMSAYSASASSEKKRLLDENLAAMIALDLLPPSVVENKGFMKLMRVAEPQYVLPSRKKLKTELLPDLYNATSEVIQGMLDGIHNVAISTDLWLTGNQADYFTIAAHYISPNDWKFHSLNLSTSVFHATYSGENVAQEIEKSVTKWKLMDKVKMMITDSATNVLLTNQDLRWGIIPCLANLLHLVVTDAVSEDIEVTSLIERVHEVVAFYQHNDEAEMKLSAMRKSMNLPDNKLVKGASTRWNSLFYMLERVLEQVDAINAVLNLYQMEAMCLSNFDVDIMKTIITSLKPFEIVSKALSADRNTNVGMAMPLVEGLQTMMATMKGSKEPLMASLKSGLSKRFEQMWESEWIVASTLLDPRYKKFPFANKTLQGKATDNIVSEVSNIMGVDQKVFGLDEWNGGTTAADEAAEEDALWTYLDSACRTGQEAKGAPSTAAYREVYRYLESPPIPRKECPLLYWKQHEELFPSLSQLALKYMGVPATTLSSDRILSKAGESLANRKGRVNPKYVDMVLFLNKNIDS